MKTLIKWSTSTMIAFLVICFFSILLTGHTISEESSQLGKTVYSAGNAVTYDKKMDVTFTMPKDWNRYFADTKNGMSKYLKKYNMELLAVNKEWNELIEVYVYEAENGLPASLDQASGQELSAFEAQALSILDHPADTSYSVSPDKDQSYFTGSGFTFYKSVYQREIRSAKEYDMVCDFMTIKDGYILDFCGYYTGETPEAATESRLALEKRMKSLADGMCAGNTTALYKDAAGNSKWDVVKSFSFSIWILILPLAYILVCGMKIADANYLPDAITYQTLKRKGLSDETIFSNWQKDPLGLTQSKAVLGFFAVLIVLHHLVQTIGSENASIFIFLEDFGVCLVSGFFFFSGYGLIRSLKQKPGYLKGFLRKRLPGVVIPFYVCTIIFYITGLLSGNHYSLKESIGYLTGFILLNTHMWYIVEIILFYLAFFLIYRIVKNRKIAFALISVFLMLFTIGSLLLCHGKYWFQGEWWYNSSLIFVFGILFGENEGKFLSAIQKHYKLYMTISILLFAVFYRTTMYMLRHHGYWTETAFDHGYADKFMTLIPQLCLSLFFLCCLIGILLKCRFDNPILSFLGKISLELYLIHNLFIQNCDGIIGTGLYVITVLVCSLAAAAILHGLDTRLLCLVNHKPIPERTFHFSRIRTALTANIKKVSHCLRFAYHHPKKVNTILFRHLICIIVALISLFPIYTLFVNATRTSRSLMTGLSFIPEGQFAANLQGVLSEISSYTCSLYEAEAYSFIIAACSCLLSVYFGAMCAYGFERFEFNGRKFLWKVVIAAMMFSQIASSVGFYMLVIRLHLLNSFLPLILPAAATPSVVFFMRMYLRIIPLASIVEAARIDGCTELGIFHRIILPLVKPALCLQIIFTFVTFWNNSFMHSLVLHDPKYKTIAMFLSVFAGSKGASSDPSVYVLLLLATLPPLVVYILFSKNIMGQIVLGAVKE